MTQQNHRLNTIITKAHETSPYSRDVYDQYYKDTKAYTYATKEYAPADTPISLLVKKTGNLAAKMVFGMNHNDTALVSSAHQQYARLYNFQRKKDNKINFDNAYISLDTAIAQNVIEKIFALSDQTEGPLKAFLHDKQELEMKNDDFYKMHFSDPKYNVVYNLYLSAALDEPYIKGSDPSKMLDQAARLFKREPERKKDKKKKEEFFANGRRALVMGLLKYNGKADADFIGDTIEYTLSSFEQANYKRHDRQENATGYGKVEETKRAQEQARKQQLSLVTMQEILNRPKNIFLENIEWKEILKTTNTSDFVANIVKKSAWSKNYDEVRKKTEADYGAHKYTF